MREKGIEGQEEMIANPNNPSPDNIFVSTTGYIMLMVTTTLNNQTKGTSYTGQGAEVLISYSELHNVFDPTVGYGVRRWVQTYSFQGMFAPNAQGQFTPAPSASLSDIGGGYFRDVQLATLSDPAAMQWIHTNYPATFDYWIRQGIVPMATFANSPPKPSSTGIAVGVPTAVTPTGQTNTQAFQQLLNNSGNAALDKQNKFNSMNYNPVSTQGTAAKYGWIAALAVGAYVFFPKQFKKVLKH